MTALRRRLAVILITLASTPLAAQLPSPLAHAPASDPAATIVAPSAAFPTLLVVAGGSTVVQTGFPVTRIAVTNPEIAERLVLSPYTVQDHIKSLLEKTNVSSRQELVARIFLDDYLPRISAGAPLDSRGQFRNC